MVEIIAFPTRTDARHAPAERPRETPAPGREPRAAAGIELARYELPPTHIAPAPPPSGGARPAPILARLPRHCTMHASTPLCAIPHPSRPGEYKWPRLEEAHRILLRSEMDDAHDALADVLATMRLWCHLVEHGALPRIQEEGR